MSGAQVIKARAAKERAQMAGCVVSAYHRGLGHKSIAKKLGFSPRRVRTVLIEQGVYKPGSLYQTPAHKARAVAAQSKARNICPYRHSRLAFTEERRLLQAQERKYEWDWVMAYRMPKPPKKPAWGEKQRVQWRHRYATDPQFRMSHVLRKRVIKLVKRGDKAAPTFEMLGCTAAQFIAHIERQWMKGMTWANHGVGRGKWNIDHIIPCASFDLTKREQMRCFHYTNLRPLWGRTNIRKGDSTPAIHQWALL